MRAPGDFSSWFAKELSAGSYDQPGDYSYFVRACSASSNVYSSSRSQSLKTRRRLAAVVDADNRNETP